ncbi:hypothetical protein OG864_42255 [Streptomyces sp. NBC_00124]|uniref:hypothetical protein n=1 Tax=Streptomyces sp. NBC_00124 TaxID=2975662 RepID=UPI002254E71E|nr:hypothetical protein [Streptomyces sp. NBC_00124]MCX5365318.1 hypothetical protein [Streptomyces sp. NBC_00124]
MSRRTRLLLKAARCYSEAQAHTEAARCYDLLGWQWSAADAYQRAGDLEHAARTYRQAGHPEQAARCYRLLGRPELAARCWQERGRRLEAAWELLLAGEITPARQLLAGADAIGKGPQQLRLELARALTDRLDGGPTGPLLDLFPRIEARLPSLAARTERRLMLDWAVEAADRVERFDWGARLFRAAYDAPGGADVLNRWRDWATDRLGSAAWLPSEPTAGTDADRAEDRTANRLAPTARPPLGPPAETDTGRAEGP